LDIIGRDLFIEQIQVHNRDREWVTKQIENSEECRSILNKRTELLGKYYDGTYRDKAIGSKCIERVLLEVTNRCNINPPCIMCIKSWGHVSDTRDMDTETIRQFDHMLSSKAQIILAGLGEPLMHPRIWDLIDELNGDDRAIGMITNGLLLNEECCKALISRRIAWVSISLDAATADTYGRIRGQGFSVVCRNVRQLSQMRTEGRLRVAVSMVIMNSNMKEIVALSELATELGANSVQYSPLQPLVAPDEATCTYARDGYRYTDELIHCDDNESVRRRLERAEKICEQHGIEFIFTGDYAR
jgi:MoaA/NifB/PqqE/SkfB family radical SAM enzyme